ncbi:MAG: hypothetical protein LBP34_02045 [Flavobacteriaceae bacterium]|nr:hypothetical protein [Flavobacteriaceae bacterium]
MNSTLMVGGGEKLLYELALFARSQGYGVDVLILNNFRKEYYDDILTDLGVGVYRISSHKHNILKHPSNFKWKMTLKYFLAKKYSSTIIVNLSFAKKVLDMIRKPNNIHIWHISNIAQYKHIDNRFPYDESILKDERLNLWLINKYQKEELEAQYGQLKCKIHEFKLFLNKK